MRVGIGLHFGPVQAGEIGGQFTAIGDTVNVASRLQGLTRDFGCLLLASDEAVKAASLAGDEASEKGLYPLPDQAIRGRVGRLRLWGWDGPGA
jgi:adenylate cyclase